MGKHSKIEYYSMSKNNTLHILEESKLREQLKSKIDLFKYEIPEQDDIIKQWYNKSEIKVSIICAVFNHAHLVEDAIKSFLLQKTDFRFEIVLRDDASTDGTQDILLTYKNKYPDIIRLKLNHENQYSKGWRALYDFPSLIRGEFVAICQGDDFWISEKKLQLQLKQLEQNPQCVMSMGGTLNYDVLSKKVKEMGIVSKEVVYNQLPNIYYHPSSYVIRAHIWCEVIVKYFIPYKLGGDTPLRSILINYGSFCSISQVLSVYWINGHGIWTSLNNLDKAMWEFKSTYTILRIFPFNNISQYIRLIRQGNTIHSIARKDGHLLISYRYYVFKIFNKTLKIIKYIKQL